ncbi:helix-turn-helix domain-containing protein [Carnobacterium divergens]|uniref:Helix-turn-helix domain-containing protein n=1 Tax=Carnobacterium divergens TaxID=2748 RepID=A0A2R8A1L5_CARDV|nr:RodZ domain-containing protein [Carnobacterium divergens]MCO6017336.1 DUF4115 domain-containing protein [Carnobacterium divergens]TFI61219.1 helix-turn-helix domain-containing protein [Carnobacterium divergens]TFI70228.1 helix-turn-helix domain-containing protein [Carnobacterium divergens]TFI75222.1 helix-turn-helix domain-containing protein [Carnobacterium divergens]TFI81046.1 helix-turn-helix domain-containing protein [Carnobacterium divergens]
MNEIGMKLQEARKAKGYTLDDLQQMTKIQKRYLIAIEEGNFDVMPGKFYARAFIKQYADTVGLNGDQLLEEYTEDVPQTHDEEYVEKVSTSQTRSENHVANIWLEKIQSILPTIIIVAIVLAITGAIWFAATKSGNKEKEPMISKDSESVSITSSAEESSSSKKESSSEAESSKEPEKPKQEVAIASSTGSNTTYTVKNATEPGSLVLTAQGGASWVGVTIAGVQVDQKTMQSGENLEVPIPAGTTAVTIVVGNAKATKITLNGTDIPYAPEAANSVTQNIQLQLTPAS